VGFFYTTGAMNQIVGQLSATELLTFLWEPTYADLGVQPPKGASSTAKAPLDGPTLSQIAPVFSQMGPGPASIRVYPVNRPFFFINPEPPHPPGYIEGQENMVYSTPHLAVEVSNAQGVWLRFASYIYDLDFRLNPTPLSSKLSASWSAPPAMRNIALESKFTNCPGNYYGAIPAGCPDAAAGALFAHGLGESLKTRLLYLADRFPAPLNYSTGSAQRQFVTIQKSQADQILNFYGVWQ
jgi:hypothetical protein